MSLDTRFQLCFPLQEAFLDKDTGLPLSSGQIAFYKDSSRSELKPVYTISGSYPNYTYVELPNPMLLSAIGTFEDDSGNDIVPYLFPYDGTPDTTTNTPENYYITVYSFEGVLQFTRQAWPNLASSSSAFSNPNYNYIRNGAFYAWDNGTTFTNVGVGSASTTDFLLNDWSYAQNDSSQTIAISQGVFSPGQTLVPGNPPFYLDYNNTGVGSGTGTSNKLTQTFVNANTLSGQTVAVDIWANQFSGASAALSVTISQNFGGGGSSTVNTTATLSAGMTVGSWTQYFVTFDIPSITGKTVGTNSELEISINLPLNQVARIGLCNLRLRASNTLTSYMPISNDDQRRLTNALTIYPPFSTGDVKATYKATADIGWLMLDDTSIGKTGSGATHTGWSLYNLYATLWNNVSNSYAPVSTGRGANPAADWNAGKTLTLCKILGRAIASAGTPSSGTNTGTAWALGQTTGNEETDITINQMPNHEHEAAAGSGGQFLFTGGTNNAYVNTGANAGTLAATTGNVLTHAPGQDALLMQPPETYLNVMIKL
jgi:hypothetical protein